VSRPADVLTEAAMDDVRAAAATLEEQGWHTNLILSNDDETGTRHVALVVSFAVDPHPQADPSPPSGREMDWTEPGRTGLLRRRPRADAEPDAPSAS
jgi:hypothetical protein